MVLLPALAAEIVIPFCAIVGIAFSLVQWRHRSRSSDNRIDEEQKLDEFTYTIIKKGVSEGVKSFLFMEYRFVRAFVGAFAILIFLCLGSVERFSIQSRPCKFHPSNTCKPALATAVFGTVSFLLGAFTSVLSGFLGMKIAIYADARISSKEKSGIGRPFITAFRSGTVMGFLIAGIGLLVLYLAINLFKLYYGNDWEGLFEAITGYGLGGSSMALFGRASGGIYAKATDVCLRLVKNIMRNSPDDDRNPAVIPCYVGDIVGDIAGVGTDLFGFYAESSCAALVVASISSFGANHDFTALCYPLLISSMGILVCLITTLLGEIMPGLKEQLIISTILMTFGIAIVSWIALPPSFTIDNFGSPKVVKNWQLLLCVCVGLWAGLISGFVAKYYTNDAFSCLQAAPQNVSVALGSVSIPFFAAVSIFVSSGFAATYGIAVAALGMLSPIATRLAIDAYGSISDHAKRIAEGAGVGAFEAAGKTTAATGKGFAIESAALVSVALIGAFVSRAAISHGDALTLKFLIGLTVGASLPYKFSAMTMKSAGRAGVKMAEEVCPQLEDGSVLMGGHKEPIYSTCFKILTDASFLEMILPGSLVMFTPLFFGTVFGVETLSGVLAGSLGSVVQIAISASNNRGAWNNAKDYIKAGASEYAETLDPEKWGLLRKAAKSEYASGNQQKDTSVPPLNILIQLMAVESLVFTPFFVTYGGLLFKIF